ncbi:PBECR2 nuclease fold domain-containing protein [Micavibrio aeruginosavorus]|uniref:PBECR2 nuclease fold domain-containing protein n=1 Tax=Micavibrio aeruginosavorus TaxID=349221 RepID=UPI003F4AD134
MSDIELKALPPKQAIEFFRSKGYKVTFDWRDMASEDHAYSFTVAKAMRADILQDIRQAVDTAIADGTTLETFKARLRPTLQEKGWWGRKEMLDPLTGEMKEVQLGSSRRLRTIFDTNMRTAYAAGKWETVQRTKKTQPYLRYLCVLDNSTRDSHRQWHNVVKHADDPFWDEHYPPNGWGCRCTVQQLSERDIQSLGLSVTPGSPTGPDRNWIDKRNGQLVKVPQGIAPGFAQNVGKARMKALTPPPLDQPLKIPYSGPLIDTPPPAPRAMDKKLILPDDLPDEEYVELFLKEFGGKIGQPVIFKDKLGEQLIISDDLFRTANGKLKVKRRDRHRHVLLLAHAIKDPDEIFWTWQEYPQGRMTLTRTYLTQWDDGGTNGFTMFDTSAAGWNGITSFQTDDLRYILNQRKGTLAYRRGKK